MFLGDMARHSNLIIQNYILKSPYFDIIPHSQERGKMGPSWCHFQKI